MIKFEKWHGNGNDFFIVNAIDNKIKIKKSFIKKAANRNKGIGFDQLIKIDIPAKDNHDFFIRFFNCDGSEAKMCLNGIRCAASYIWNNSFAPRNELSFMTKMGIVHCIPSKSSKVSVAIKKPVPIQDDRFHKIIKNKLDKNYSLLNIGNNHLCIKMRSIDKIDLIKIYDELPVSLRKIAINLSVYKKEGDKIYIRTYENGVGETLSCGSAALCTASIYINNKVRAIEVSSIGGKLNFKKYNNGILINGSTNFIFKGNIND